MNEKKNEKLIIRQKEKINGLIVELTELYKLYEKKTSDFDDKSNHDVDENDFFKKLGEDLTENYNKLSSLIKNEEKILNELERKKLFIP